MDETERVTCSQPHERPRIWIAVAFFASGFSALVYQVVWQRVLYANFGINIESVTIVVTAFLAGLGIGSLVGGKLSLSERLALPIFAAIEISIGLYGWMSVPLFRSLANGVTNVGPSGVSILLVGLIVVPTTLMGATLPILVAHSVRRSIGVGASMGRLYFANTAGSALAALACSAVLMGTLGESRTVHLASAANIVVGLFVLAVGSSKRAT